MSKKFSSYFSYRRGKKLSTGVQNVAFDGDVSAFPLWDQNGAGIPVQKQLFVTGAATVLPYELRVKGDPVPAKSPGTIGVITNPFMNEGTLGGVDN